MSTSCRLQLWHKNTHGESAPTEVIALIVIIMMIIIMIIIIIIDHHHYNYHDQLVVTTLVEPIKQMAETKMAGGLITKVIIMVILIEILNGILKMMILNCHYRTSQATVHSSLLLLQGDNYCSDMSFIPSPQTKLFWQKKSLQLRRSNQRGSNHDGSCSQVNDEGNYTN